MKALLSLLRAEILKLKRTLALWMVLVAPAVVVAMQIMLLLNRKAGWDADVDYWKFFATTTLSMWSIFMLPLFTALMVALVYGFEHGTNGWLKLYTLPVPKWSVVAAKQIVTALLLLTSTAALAALIIAGGFVLDALHPGLEMPARIPLGTICARAGLTFASALAILALQNWVSMRWSALSASVGVGIAGTFFALFASGWKYGYLYPWLIPIRVLYGDGYHSSIALMAGILGGLLIFAGTVYQSVKKDPALQ